MKSRGLLIFAWGLSILVTALALVAWVQGYNIEVSSLNAYLLFPALGLIAFSLMWTHYIVGAIRRMTGVDKESLKSYTRITGAVVLLAIVLHPGLLIWQLWQDGAGLPPDSYINYVGPALKWATFFGSVSLLIFLSFETKKWFKDRGWWPVVEYAQAVAMFLIIFHGLALGSNLQAGWYRGMWMIYAFSLVLSLTYLYYVETIQAKQEGKLMNKVIGILIVAILVLGGGYYTYTQLSGDDEAEESVTTLTSDQTGSQSSAAVSQTYTLAEVQAHNSKTDCWTVIEGGVYDITSYIPRHPGGNDILLACGTDGTTLFTQRTDSSGNAVGSGEPHSSSAASQLASFKVGTLQ